MWEPGQKNKKLVSWVWLLFCRFRKEAEADWDCHRGRDSSSQEDKASDPQYISKKEESKLSYFLLRASLLKNRKKNLGSSWQLYAWPGTRVHVCSSGSLFCYVTTPFSVSHFILLQTEKRASSPFRRIREEEIEVDARVADNSFDAKVRRKGVHHSWSGCSYCFGWMGSCLGSACLEQKESDWTLVSFVLTTSLYSPARCSRRLGGTSQSGPKVHQRQILPAWEDQEEEGQLPGRLHLCPGQFN